MSDYKKISLIGNCQTACYAKYLKELIPDAFFVKWLCPDLFFKNEWPYLDIWDMNKENHVTNQNEVESYLINSDLIICNNISEKKSKKHNINKIRSTYSAKVISVTSANENIEGMKQRESTKDIDIKLSSVFEEDPEKAFFLKSWHPNTWGLLKCVEKICKEIDIDFFNEADFAKHIKTGYPFELS